MEHTIAELSKIDSLAYGRLTSLINSMADGVIAVNSHSKVVLFNSATLNVLDRNNVKIGDSLDDLMDLIDKNNHPVDVLTLVESTKLPTVNRDLRIVYKDGSASNLYISIAPVHLSYGQDGLEGYVIMLRDITTEKSLEEERDEFISVVSHELRTPIAIAEGNISNAQLIVEKNGDIQMVTKALKDAHNQVLYLSDMINDLSTLSRAERGKLTIEIDQINVHELILELAGNYQPDADAKGLSIKTDIDPNLELLSTSKLYCREILQNFITNAIKYTQKGYITIGAKQKGNGIEFSVADTGIGISKSDQERVFDKFFRSEDYRTRQSSGTGLGLYVTMKLARLTNADISFTSELNKGSTFIIYMPNISPVEAKAKNETANIS